MYNASASLCRLLCFDFVFALEHIVNFHKIVGALGDRRNVAFGSVGMLHICFFAKITRLNTNQLLFFLHYSPELTAS